MGPDKPQELVQAQFLWFSHLNWASVNGVSFNEIDPDEITSDSDDKAEYDTEESIPANNQSVQRGGRSQGSHARIRGGERSLRHQSKG